MEHLSRRLLHRFTRDVSRELAMQRTLGVVRIVVNRFPKFLIHRHNHLLGTDVIEPRLASEAYVEASVCRIASGLTETSFTAWDVSELVRFLAIRTARLTVSRWKRSVPSTTERGRTRS